jgi:hypothetical protein
MKAGSRVLAAVSSLTLALLITGAAFAQTTGTRAPTADAG